MRASLVLVVIGTLVMKQAHRIKPFFFTSPNILQELEQEMPIKLKKLENLIDRVHRRYPIISKMEVALIIKTAFEGMRELLVSGCILNFNRFVTDMKLHFGTHGPRFAKVKVKLMTSPQLKEISHD